MKYTYPVVVAIITVITFAVASALGVGLPIKVSQTAVSGSELSVVGEGKVDVTPDLAYVDVGVTVNKASTPKDAQNQLAKVNNDLVAALKKFEISKEDIKTTNFSVNPNYDYSSGGGGSIVGYNGNATLTVKIRRPDKIGEIIEAATSAGATDIYNTRFSVDKPEKYREQARSKAIANAKEQASQIAKELGIKLGKVTNIVESSGSSGSLPVYSEKAMGLGGGGGVADLQSGSQTVSSVVTLYFEKR
ncbi:MAG: SIMPL domain-containing protein [Patescibacteria group bacterium]